MTGQPIQLLIKSKGIFTKEMLTSAWSTILNEYSELIRTEKSDTIFKCWKSIQENEFKMKLMERCILYLKFTFDPEIADMVANLGYDLIVDKDDYDEYYKQLEIMENEVGTLLVLTNQLYIEYRKLAPIQEQMNQRTEMDYEKEIALMSKYQGSRIIKERITVFEWAAIVNNYIEDNKRRKK